VRGGKGGKKTKREVCAELEVHFGHGRKRSSICETSVMANRYDECKNNHPDWSRPRSVSEASFEIPEGEEVPEPKLPPGTRFIDVQKMKLVTAKIECEFVALSYVWFLFLF
jgi:hypothetical protein